MYCIVLEDVYQFVVNAPAMC